MPKPPEQRRRRNAAPPVKKVAAPRVGRRKAPDLPSGQEWHPRTVACWETIWASPIARVWIDVDVLALVRWAALLDLVHTGQDKTYTHQEIRMLEDRFGLSPLARRRLQWEIDEASKGDVKAPAEKAEEGRWLRAVSG